MVFTNRRINSIISGPFIITLKRFGKKANWYWELRYFFISNNLYLNVIMLLQTNLYKVSNSKGRYIKKMRIYLFNVMILQIFPFELILKRNRYFDEITL